ncbi:MAG: hypothetical protein Aurels2KO_15960 [Aureliella sp.]
MKPPRIFPTTCLALLCLVLTGCRENAGTWGEEKVKDKIIEKLELTDATLEPAESGFTGSGKREDGETVSFTIEQDPETGRMSWDAQGDRGFFEDGYYELK